MACRVLDHFDHVSHCPICKEVLKDPRLILCGHTFCLGCLQSILFTGPRLVEQVLECPLCKKISKIPKGGAQNFPLNVMALQVQTAVDEALQTMKHSYCDACGERATEHVFCRDCEVKLCPICGPNHQLVFKTHTIAEDLGSVPATRCGKHPGKMISVYCINCSVAVCPLCATSNHVGSSHGVIPLEEAKDNFVKVVKDKIANLKEGRKKMAGGQDRLDRMRRNAVDNYAFQKGLVESVSLKAVSRIRKAEEELKKTIQELHDNNIRILDKMEREMKEKSTSLDDILDRAEKAIEDIQIADFPDKSVELCGVLETAENDVGYIDSVDVVQEYSFAINENSLERGLGSIVMPLNDSYTNMDIQKPYQQEVEEGAVTSRVSTNEGDQKVEMRMKSAVTLDLQPTVPLQMLDQTRRKDYYSDAPMLIGSYVLESGIPNIPIKMIGVGLLPNNDVICAYNTNMMGQVVLCTQPNKHQVLYHRRKGISAFALYKDEECGVVLEDDCNISRLILSDIPADREVTCRTHKISCRASNIGALAFNPEGVMVISDTNKNCLTGIDRQSKRPFNLNGNRNETTGCFSTTKGLASGPLGEIILYDGEKQRLAVFSRDTKFLRYIALPGMSSDCTIACDDIGILYVADTKQNKVMKLSMTGDEQMEEILNASHGLNSPTCICVQGRSLAVANGKSFSEGEIRVFEFGDYLNTHF